MTAEEIKQDIIEKKRNVTLKTLKTWLEQTEKIRHDKELVPNNEVSNNLRELMDSIKENFINNKF